MEQEYYYKGFDKDLKCKGLQYQEGTLNIFYGDIKLCHRGFHFCYKLSDCFAYYSNSLGNKFALVKVAGKIQHGSDKGVCDALTIVKVLTTEEVKTIVQKEKSDLIDRSIHLDDLYALSQKYNIIITGSIGLYLQGITLDRTLGNWDLILPYYQRFENMLQEPSISKSRDFNEQWHIKVGKGSSKKVDIKVDPFRKYINIEYKGMTFKVAHYLEIIQAKLRYALEGNTKHIADLDYLIKGLSQSLITW